jgi:hypothetical protein
MKRSNAVSNVPFLKRPEDPAGLPVLTDVLVPARSKSGRTLWLAWDERRVPLLDKVVDDAELARQPLNVWRRRGDRERSR